MSHLILIPLEDCSEFGNFVITLIYEIVKHVYTLYIYLILTVMDNVSLKLCI
jgi:hypothetical protein